MPWSYLSVSTAGGCSRSGACSSCLGNIRWRGKPLSRSKTCMRWYFSKGSDATSQADFKQLVLPTIQALNLRTGAIRKGIFSKWHPPVLAASWRESTLPGCRRSPLFQLRATQSGARCSFWPWRGGSIRRRLTPLSRLLVFTTGPVRWTNSAAHLPLTLNKDNVRKADAQGEGSLL